jgi:transposase InsO family protein
MLILFMLMIADASSYPQNIIDWSVGAGSTIACGYVKGIGMGYTPSNSFAGSVRFESSAGMTAPEVLICFAGKVGPVRAGLTPKGVIFDGGCSWHLSGDKNLFSSPLRRCAPKRILGFDSTSHGLVATRVGDIQYWGVKNGRPALIKVKNVLYVPEMGELTLISQGVLDDKGYAMKVHKGLVHVWNSKGNKCFEARKASEDRLYHCDSGAWGSCLLSPFVETLQEAHLTFGHLGCDHLHKLGEFSGDIDCETCKLVKSTRQRYSKESHTNIPHVGHTVVTDVKEMKSHSNKGNKYIITFMDRKSRYLRVYFMKRKSEATIKAKHFLEWVHNQRGRYPKNLHSDGGGEYITVNLRSFCDDHGVNLRHTQPYSPQQNAIAERINRTIAEGAAALLVQAGLPQCFWEEAVNHFVFIKNRTPHKKLEGKNPQEVWDEELLEGDGVGIWDILPFGCQTFVHIPEARRPPGEEHIRARKCVYLGRSDWKKTDIHYDYTNDRCSR